MPNLPAIALVGAGAAAVCVLRALVDSGLGGGSVTVFEPTELLWQGRAYQVDTGCVRTNAVPGDMSVCHGDPMNFAQWLAVRDLTEGASDTEDHGLRYPPRSVYGEYLQTSARTALASLLRHGWQLRLDRSAVTRASAESGQVLLHTGSGRAYRFSRVILCVGGDRSQDVYKLSGLSGFTPDPYPLRHTLPGIPPRAHVATLGSGLTAVDTVLALSERGHQGPISMVSRTGILPGVRQYPLPDPHETAPAHWSDLPPCGAAGLPWTAAMPWLRGLLTDAGCDLSALRREITAAGTEPPLPRLRRHLHAVDAPDPALRLLQQAVPFLGPRLWSQLDEHDRGRILQRHLRAIVSLCCPMAPHSATVLLNLADRGQLRFHRGLDQVRPAPGSGFLLRTADERPVRVDHIVNALGAAPDRIPAAALPLVGSMIAAGMALPHPHGGLRTDPRSSRLLTSHGPDPRLYAIGDITQGTFLFTFGIPALVERAHELVTELHHHHAGSTASRRRSHPCV